MSAQVDVLAVMRDGAADYDESGHDGLAADMRKARAAVAALIAERDALRDKEHQAFSDGVILGLQIMTSGGDMGSRQYEELLNSADAIAIYMRAEAEGMLELSGLADYVAQKDYEPSRQLRKGLIANGVKV